jgi:multiple sugar transport system substrate-binding protein
MIEGAGMETPHTVPQSPAKPASGSTERRDSRRVAILVAIMAVAGTVAFWLDESTLRIAIHQGVEGVALRALARDYSRATGVRVEVFELPYSALYEAELRAVTAEPDTGPYDVIMVDDPWLPALIGEDEDGDSNRLARLEFERGECDSLDLADFVETTLQVSVHPSHRRSPSPTASAAPPLRCGDPADGLYAVPFVGNSQLFLVRKDLPQPRTWPEVRSLTLAQSMDDAGYVTRVGAGNSIVTDFMTILWTLEPDTRGPAVRLAGLRPAALDPFPFGQEQTLAPFEFVRAIGAPPRANRGVVSVDDFDLAIHLVENRASMTIAWSAWVMAIAKLPRPYNRQLLDLDGGETGTFRVTEVPGDRPVLGAWLLAIPAASPNTRGARKFLLWATAKDQMITAAKHGNPPPRRSTFAHRDVRALYGPFLQQQLQSLQRAEARPRTPFWRDVENVLGDCLTALYEGAVTPRDAWQEADRGLELLRERQRQIENVRAAAADGDEARVKIREILDEPIEPFSCTAR